MLLVLLAWIYITILCLAWGNLVLRGMRFIAGDNRPVSFHFSITCLLGLAGITLFGSLLSFLLPLGGWLPHLLLLMPCLFFIRNITGTASLTIFKRYFTQLHYSLLFLFAACILMVLLLSTREITNQDTLAYHAPIIQWIEKYKAIPGIANLHLRYGYQSSWFISCALFSFKFAGAHALTFINSAVLLWFFAFIIDQLNEYFSGKFNRMGLLVLTGLLAIALWSYSQVRLMSTSASPDFVVAIYTWLLFYWLKNNLSSVIFFLLAVVSIFVISIKISAAPVCIITLYSFYKLINLKRIKPALVALATCLVIAISFTGRNIISSGYALFPSVFPDIANVDWKLHSANAIIAKKYVTAYARMDTEATAADTERVFSLKASEWVPLWWKGLSAANKTLLILAFLSMLILLVQPSGITRSTTSTKIILATLIAGLIAWFTQAPDPRFGLGYIMALPVIAALSYKSIAALSARWLQNAFHGLIIVFAIAISCYNVYSIMDFPVSQVLTPRGIQPVAYRTINCRGISINVPQTMYSCGSTNLPCAYDSCATFEPRGTGISEGFKPK